MGRVGLGPAKKLMFLFTRYWFIYYILVDCNSKQTQSHTYIYWRWHSILLRCACVMDWLTIPEKPCCSSCQTLWAPRLILESKTQAVNNILPEYGPEYGLGWVHLPLGWVGSTNMDSCPSLVAGHLRPTATFNLRSQMAGDRYVSVVRRSLVYISVSLSQFSSRNALARSVGLRVHNPAVVSKPCTDLYAAFVTAKWLIPRQSVVTEDR